MAWYDWTIGPAGPLIRKGVEWATQESDSAKQQRDSLSQQGGASSAFADKAEGAYGQLGAEGDRLRQMLYEQATGKKSVSGEMLRQGLDQQLTQQQSMAASAAPRDAAMAARTAANNMGRASYGMSGQAAVAGMQEKMAASQALADALYKQRQQDMQVGLGARQNAISGYGGMTPQKSPLEQMLPVINAGVGAVGAIKGGGR